MNSPTNYDLMRLFEDHKETIRSGLKEVRQVRVPFPPPPIFVSDKEPEPDFAYLAVARFEIRYIPVSYTHLTLPTTPYV